MWYLIGEEDIVLLYVYIVYHSVDSTGKIT